MERSYNRRKFIRDTTLAGVALGISRSGNAALQFSSRSKKLNEVGTGKRIGIIGLDTSHSVAFTEALNDPLADKAFRRYSRAPGRHGVWLGCHAMSPGASQNRK